MNLKLGGVSILGRIAKLASLGTGIVLAAFLITVPAVHAQLRPETKAPDNKPKPALVTDPSAPDSTTETFGDWSVVCSALNGSTEKLCEVDTAITLRGQSAPVVRIAFGRPARDKPVRLIVIVPTNVLIAPGVKVDFDDGKAGASLAFKSCTAAGCFAETELSNEQLHGFRGHAQPGRISLTEPAGKAVALGLSFRGFDQALDSYLKR